MAIGALLGSPKALRVLARLADQRDRLPASSPSTRGLLDRLPDPSPRSNRRWYRRARLTVVFVAIAANWCVVC